MYHLGKDINMKPEELMQRMVAEKEPIKAGSTVFNKKTNRRYLVIRVNSRWGYAKCADDDGEYYYPLPDLVKVP
jgi:hypothetical protein